MSETGLTIADIQHAHERIGGSVYRTPILRSQALDEQLGMELFFKAEHLQVSGSFKVRGALNAIALALESAVRPPGIITFSAGNHAASVAYAAQKFGLPAIVCMPQGAVEEKVAAARGYGAQVRLIDGDLPAACLALSEETGYLLIQPFDAIEVMAGQGTVGLEILENVPELDVLIAPVGGGGLLGGVSTAVSAGAPDAQIYAAEPRTAALLRQSIDSGEPAVHASRPVTIADGLAAPFLGKACLAELAPRVSGTVEVSEEEIKAELAVLLKVLKQSVEPSAAVGLAAARQLSPTLQGKQVAIVLTGGNISSALLAEIAAS